MTQTRKKRLLWALCLAALALFAAAMVWLHYQQLCATGRGEDPYTSDLGQHLHFAQSGLIYSATSLLIGPAYAAGGKLGIALLLAVFASASAEEILYTGTVSKPMTIRAKKSTSAAKLGSVEPGELINIVEYGSEWTKVDQNGVVGYVLTRNVEDLAAAAGYNDEADAQYLGVAERKANPRRSCSSSKRAKRCTSPSWARSGSPW